MRQVNSQLAGTLRRMHRDPGLTDFIDWLRESLEDIRKSNDSLEGIELTRSQGKAQVIDRILREIEFSDETWERFARNEKTRELNNLDGSTVE